MEHDFWKLDSKQTPRAVQSSDVWLEAFKQALKQAHVSIGVYEPMDHAVAEANKAADAFEKRYVEPYAFKPMDTSQWP